TKDELRRGSGFQIARPGGVAVGVAQVPRTVGPQEPEQERPLAARRASSHPKLAGIAESVAAPPLPNERVQQPQDPVENPKDDPPERRAATRSPRACPRSPSQRPGHAPVMPRSRPGHARSPSGHAPVTPDLRPSHRPTYARVTPGQALL